MVLFRTHRRSLFIWTTLWGLFFATLLLGTERLHNSDFSSQFHAFALFQSRQLLSGVWPFWSNGSYGGFPFVADPQSAVFYPIRWLIILLFSPWQMPFYALEFEALFHIWLAGIFTYFLVFDITKKQSAALISCIAFGFSAYLTTYPLLQLAILETMTWLPLALLLIRRHIQVGADNQRTPLPLGVGLTLAVAIMAGHPQTALQVCYVAVAYYLFHALTAGWHGWSIIRNGMVIAAVGLGVSAATWLPVVQYTQQTSRADVGYEFVNGGLPMRHYFEMWLPHSLTGWSPTYVGIVVLALAGVAFFGRTSRPKHHSEIRFWAALVFILSVMALGDKGLLFETAYNTLPGFTLFRQQERWFGMVALGLSILSGCGVAIWSQLTIQQHKPIWRRCAMLLLGGWFVSTVTVWLITNDPPFDLYLQQLGIILGVLFLLYQTGESQGAQKISWRLVALAGILAVDLFSVSQIGLNRVAGSPSIFWANPDWLQQLKADPDRQRIDSLNIFWGNFGELSGMEDIRGISPLKNEALEQFEQLPTPRLWELLNVSHTLWDGKPNGVPMQHVADIPKTIVPDEVRVAQVYKLDNPTPRAWMSYEPLLLSAEDGFNQLKDMQFDLFKHVILPPETIGLDQISPPTTPPQVTVIDKAAGLLHLSVETETDGVLVASEWLMEGWQAQVDGKSAELLPAYHALQAIILPAGTHDMILRYVPTLAYIGIGISLLTLAGCWLLRRQTFNITTQIGRSEQASPTLRSPRSMRFTSYLTHHRWQIALLLIILLAFFLRMQTAATQELRGDEAFSFLATDQGFNRIIPLMRSTDDPHPPTHYMLLYASRQLFGDSELALRMLPILASTLVVPLIAALGRKIRYTQTRAISLLAALLIAVSKSQIWIGHDVRSQYAFVLCATLGATLALDRARRHNSVGAWSVYALLAAATVYSHYYGIFVLIAHAFYVYQHNYLIWRRWVMSGGTAALAFLPWMLYLYDVTLNNQLSNPQKINLGGHVKDTAIELGFGGVWGGWQNSLLLCAVVLIGIGAIQLCRQKPRWGYLLTGWLLLTIWGVYLIRLQRDQHNAYHMVVAAPAWWLLLSIGVWRVWEWGKVWHKSASVLLAFLIIGGNGVAVRQYFGDTVAFGRNSGYHKITDTLTTYATPNDIFIPNAPDPSLTYYLSNFDLQRTMQPDRWGMSREEIIAELDTLIADRERIWFVPADPQYSFDQESVVRSYLEENYFWEFDLDLARQELMAFRPKTTASATPINATLPDQLQLNSFFLTKNGEPFAEGEGIRPNDKFTVTFLWEALGPIPTNYKVFVHLLAENGTLITQHDSDPANGLRFTSTWQTGEQILDRHTLTIPADAVAQSSQLIVGIYHPETVERQIFDIGDDSILLGELLIVTGNQ